MQRPPRIRLESAAKMIAADGHETEVMILDVSAVGFRLEHADDLQAGDRITLVTAKAERIRASIRWSIGKEAGGTFDEEPMALA